MDIDIDTPTSFDPLDIFEMAIRASMVKDKTIVKHPVGTYLQNIPKDKVTNLSAIPYKEAEDQGYFKIDFLHLHVLDVFESKEEIRALLKKEPDWNLLLIPSVVPKLFQLGNHYDLLQKVKPRSVLELADCIALIRPKKRMLVDKYIKDKDAVRKLIYLIDNGDKSSYKKSHAVAYAMTIVLQLHLIKANII